jgi:hypothetical protein
LKRLFVVLLVALSLPVAAEDIAPGSFAFGTVVDTDGASPLHAVRLPGAVYQRSTRADLADLRVFNAAAQPVPFAIRATPVPVETQPAGVVLPVFPLPGAEPVTAETPLHVRIESGGALVSIDRGRTPASVAATTYLIDASALRTPVAALELVFEGTAPLVARVDVEVSDDLRSFRMVNAGAPLLRTQLGGQSLSQMRVELGSVRAKYYRIHASAGSFGAALDRVTAMPPAQSGSAPREHLVAVNGKADGKAFVYELDGAYPADRVSVDPGEDNAVLPFEIDGRDGAGGDWVRLGSGTAYRFKQGDVTISSPTIAVRTGAWRAWRVRITGNAPTGNAPRLRLEWIPAEVVFAAQGAGPFMLAYGSGSVQTSGALPIATLIPGYGTDKAVEPAIATAGTNVQLAGPQALKPTADVRQWGLWGVMGAGALVLGLMAARLLRQSRSGTPPRT